MPRGKPLRNANGYGSVVKLSGNRRKPFEVRVNTRMDERYYPVYDVLGRYSTREEGLMALAEGTFKGGLKTEAGKNRIVSIHSKIRGFVEHRLSVNHGILFSLNDKPISTAAYTKLFKKALKDIGINTYPLKHRGIKTDY